MRAFAAAATESDDDTNYSDYERHNVSSPSDLCLSLDHAYSASSTPAQDFVDAVTKIINNVAKTNARVEPRPTRQSRYAPQQDRGGRSGKGRGNITGGNAESNKPRLYCYRHGYDNHSGQDCRVPKVGHRARDTKHGSQGSSDRNF